MPRDVVSGAMNKARPEFPQPSGNLIFLRISKPGDETVLFQSRTKTMDRLFGKVEGFIYLACSHCMIVSPQNFKNEKCSEVCWNPF